jgi:hypothetical protein
MDMLCRFMFTFLYISLVTLDLFVEKHCTFVDNDMLVFFFFRIRPCKLGFFNLKVTRDSIWVIIIFPMYIILFSNFYCSEDENTHGDSLLSSSRYCRLKFVYVFVKMKSYYLRIKRCPSIILYTL